MRSVWQLDAGMNIPRAPLAVAEEPRLLPIDLVVGGTAEDRRLAAVFPSSPRLQVPLCEIELDLPGCHDIRTLPNCGLDRGSWISHKKLVSIQNHPPVLFRELAVHLVEDSRPQPVAIRFARLFEGDDVAVPAT